MSSNAPTTAEVRPFPNAKVAPATEAPSAPVEPVTTAPAETPARKKRSVRSFLLPIIGVALLSAGAWYGYNYWTTGRFMISTDDAYVQADMAFISPKISGYVDQIKVSENQKVKAGDPLLVVDDGDYRIAVAQAEAQIATLSKTLDRIDAQTEAAQCLAAAGAGAEDRRPGRRRQCGEGRRARLAAAQDACRHAGAAG